MPNDGDRRHDHICKAISFWTWYEWKMYDDFSRSFLPNEEAKIRMMAKLTEKALNMNLILHILAMTI